MKKIRYIIGYLLYNMLFQFLPHYQLGYKWPISNFCRRICVKIMYKNCGKKIDIGRYIKFSHELHIDDNSSLGDYTYIQGKLKIGKNCMIAPKVTFLGSNHNFENKNILMNQQGSNSKGIVIEDNVWIGYGTIITDGVKIESGSVVAAGSVVTKNVESNTIVGGVPAKKIRGR